MVADPLKPKRGGFLRSFGCAWFVREYLAGHGPYGSPIIDQDIGAPQADIFREYKDALRRATALDRGIRGEERLARKENRPINPDNIEGLAKRHLAQMPYKAWGCRSHSFNTYFSTIKKLGWVEPTSKEEPSSFQQNYAEGQPRKYYRLTKKGKEVGDAAWADPHRALYG